MLQRSPLRADPGAVLLAATEIAPAGYRPSRVRGVGCFRRNTPSFAAKAGRGRARSEFATRPWERAPQGSRRSRSPQRNVAACPGSALLRRTPFKQPTLKLSNAPLPLVRAKVDGALAGALPHRSRASRPRFGSESRFNPLFCMARIVHGVAPSGQRRLASGTRRNQDNGVLSRLRKRVAQGGRRFVFVFRWQGIHHAEA